MINLNKKIISTWRKDYSYTLYDIFEYIKMLVNNYKYKDKINYIKLFGSYAKGTETSSSDVDIFISCKDLTNQELVEIGAYFWDELVIKFAVDVDVITNNEEDIDNRRIYRDIINEGVLIWNYID